MDSVTRWDFIKQVKGAWALRKQLSHAENTLLSVFVEIGNEQGRRETFRADNASIAERAGMKVPNVIAVRRTLQEKGIITWEPGKKGTPTVYKMRILYNEGKGYAETTLNEGKRYPHDTENEEKGYDEHTETKEKGYDEHTLNYDEHTLNYDEHTEKIPKATPDKDSGTRKSIVKGLVKDIRANDLFLKFYQAYPKRKGKRDAEKAFMKLNPDADLFQRMMQALETQKASADWRKDNGRFVPYPATWLNGARWEDEVGGTAKQPTMTQEEMEALRERVEREQEERARLEAERWKQRGTN